MRRWLICNIFILLASLPQAATQSPAISSPSDLVDVVRELKTTVSAKNLEGALIRSYQRTLSIQLNDSAFSSFKAKVVDTGAPDEARIMLLRVMILKSPKLSASHCDSLNQLMTSLLSGASASKAMKAFVLKELGGNASVTNDQVFVPYLTSSDTALKAAAYYGLGRKIRANRAAGNGQGNLAIFGDLKTLADQNADIYSVRAIAQLSEDYARDYLAAKCAGDPEKLKAVLYHDAGLSHAGLLKEAAAAMGLSGQESSMRKAIRYGAKNPNQAVTSLLQGSTDSVTAGLNLLRVFPDLVPGHQEFISGLQSSPDTTIKNAAQALTPYFETADAN